MRHQTADYCSLHQPLGAYPCSTDQHDEYEHARYVLVHASARVRTRKPLRLRYEIDEIVYNLSLEMLAGNQGDADRCENSFGTTDSLCCCQLMA